MAADRPRLKGHPYHRALFFGLGVVSIFLLWQITALGFNSDLIFPGPMTVIPRCWAILCEVVFWQSCAASFFRSIGAFVLCFVASLPIGIAMGRNRTLEAFLSPYLSILRSTPVISVIILGLLWFSADIAPMWVCSLTIIPILSQSVLEGVHAVDPRLEECCRSFGMKGWRLTRMFLLPSLIPFLRAGGKASIGLSWKIVAAAEVLSLPEKGIGSMLQNARSALETDEVFSLTIILVMLAFTGELIISAVLKFPYERYLEKKPS